MTQWLERHGLVVNFWLALAAIVVPVVAVAIPQFRQAVGRGWHRLRLRLGAPERHYAGWFVKTYGRYENPYLADTERLDLRSTFISLAFRGENDEIERRVVATEALAARDAGNLMIEGGPGSGKSTLLRAYGVGVLQPRGAYGASIFQPWRRRQPMATPFAEVPFLVPLRRLARTLPQHGSLTEYLLAEILVSQAGMARDQAEAFFDRVLESGRLLVLLDGLDEVTAERYPSVLDAVQRFRGEHNPVRPTHQARLIITCRRQNLLGIKDDWLSEIVQRLYALAPLRDTEMFAYLDRHRTKFKSPTGPETFMNAVRASPTLEMHRVPLVLAMSVGLFVRRDVYEIPHSISLLYETMVRELLDRHWFKHHQDRPSAANQFRTSDKYRLLREFALHAASSATGFEDFSRKELLDLAKTLRQRLEAVRPVETASFIDEIIDRSGLLSSVSDEAGYVFVHRSVQEHLVAQQLLLPDAAGPDTLLARATDPQWRQVILFFTAAADQQVVNPFLTRLAQIDLELAGHCLAGADADDEVALPIIHDLARRTAQPESAVTGLAALLRAAGSQRLKTQEEAIAHIEAVLSDRMARQDLHIVLGGDTDNVLRVLNSLAGANTTKIARLVPPVAMMVPDDPRLVEPLWRCLTAPGIEHDPASDEIVQRLLHLVVDPACRAELERQSSYAPPFITQELRERAYPFRRGRPLSSNLVTLLAWAEYRHRVPSIDTRFFAAKRAGPEIFAQIESAKRRTVSVALCRPAQVLCVLSLVVATLVTTGLLVFAPRTFLHPWGWWSLALLLIAPATLLAWALADDQWELYQNDNGAGNPVVSWGFADPTAFWPGFVALLLPALYGAALAPILASISAALVSLPLYLVAVAGMTTIFYYPLPALDSFIKGRRTYLYRPNPYVDMYEDPGSKHWVSPD